MALQIWLPLNGNLNNQGLTNITVTNSGTTVDTSGKIGSCYNFDGASCIKTNYVESFGTGDFSLCAWIYLVQTSGKTYQQIIGNKSTGGSSVGCAIYWNQTQKKFLWSTADGTNATEIWTSDTFDDIIYDSWHHIAMIRNNSDSSKGYFYIDGVRKNIASVPAIRNISSSTSTFSIGQCNNSTNAAYYFTGKINDVRVYDHALSADEIKQISKGLVAHYTLSRGQDNLLLDTLKDASSTHSTYNIADFNFSESVIEGDTYTVSAHVTTSSDKKSVGFFHSGGSNIMGDWIPITSSGIYKQTFVATSTMAAFTTGAGHGYCRVYTSNKTGSQGSTAITGTANVDWIKLEKGDVATLWMPNSADALYSSLKFNDGIEYDISGYEYNGTKNGTFSYESGAPMYGSSTIFNGTDNAIKVPFNAIIGSNLDYTISVWTYKTSIGSKNYQTIFGGQSGFELDARNSSNTASVYIAWNWGKPMAPYNFNEWTLFTFVHTSSDSKIYVNGKLNSTGSSNATIPTGDFFIGAWKNTSSQNFEGQMSDFRIYATALSADDVLKLYHGIE